MKVDGNNKSMSVDDVQAQIMEANNFHHATKVFDPERKINESEFNTILETARLSPSSFGMEPWQLLIIQAPMIPQIMPAPRITGLDLRRWVNSSAITST